MPGIFVEQRAPTFNQPTTPSRRENNSAHTHRDPETGRPVRARPQYAHNPDPNTIGELLLAAIRENA